MQTISTPHAPAAIGPYAQGNVVGGLLFASGQIPLDPTTGQMVGPTIEEQTHQVMRNVGAVLEAAGADYDKVVKTTCFLADMELFAAFNEVYATYFAGHLPSRSAVAVRSLPKGALVEVEVIAAVS
ncbi:RidA family protein [Eggerthellaceae bacterium zg-1084]|uniref:RidA family protein n=1 Tax=Berryella wangjianweii TaxID=2734634 RepID=UPI001552EF0E|nr:Rid family detoxifying hydrolase [Berryella wangjianweii]NPD31385.1 RidA family protein [Berryella wangjianweii]